jgi:hypothetical protein
MAAIEKVFCEKSFRFQKENVMKQKNKNEKNKAPSFLQRVLWSYNLSAIDLEKDKELVIQQVLNYGGWKEVRWLFRNYPENDIKIVVARPDRGIWFRPVLTFWTTIYNIKLDKETFENAIYEPNKIKEKYLKK